ncbi:hypothetical protein XBLMG947_1923 [Xanthomonas bromi]|uniref:Uncharacterized protein n=1 Tax=Xanthomonas bromi TaxID=56449 RepID=A0A1C3NL71_9XANT|nr:hypothetical protein XBLMG947_1923 [Xanthomonas bromi]
MPRINHHVIKMPINAEMPINQAPRCRILRWLAWMKGSMLRLGWATVRTPINLPGWSGA